MRAGEAFATTQNGCGVIGAPATQPAGFNAEGWKVELGAQVWTGSCVDGLASGWGALRKAAEANQPDPLQASAEYVDGRATGRAGQREPGTNAAVETYSVNGKTARLVSYQGSPPLVRWGFSEFIFPPQGVAKPPKEEMTRITAPDGSSVATLKAFCNAYEDKVAACRGLPNKVIYGVSLEPAGAAPSVIWCPDPFSADACQGLWEQISTAVRTAATAQMAEQSAYVQKLTAELGPQMAAWKARRGGGTVPGAGVPAAPVLDDAALFAQAALQDSQNLANEALQTRLQLLERFPNSPLAAVVKEAVAAQQKKLQAEEAERKKREAYDAGRPTLVTRCRNGDGSLEPSNAQDACTAMIESGYEDKGDLALAYQFRGSAKLVARDVKEAIADYGLAIETNPDLADAYANRGTAWIHAGDADKAVTDLGNAISIGPAQSWHYLNRGMAYRLAKDNAKAMADFDKAISLQAGNVAALRERGALHLVQQNWQKAVDDLTAALAVDADDAPTLINRGIAYYSLKSYPLAIADLDKAVSLESTNVAAYSNRANARMANGDLEGAQRDFDKVLQLDPNNADARTGRANVQVRLMSTP